MALNACRECGKEISTQALSCPQCGARTPRASNLYRAVAGVILLLVIAAGAWWKVQPSAAEKATTIANDSVMSRLDLQAKARVADSLAIDSAYDAQARDTTSSLWGEAASQAHAFKITTDSVLHLFRSYNHLIRAKNSRIFPGFAIGATSYAIERRGIRGTLSDYFMATLILYQRGYDNVLVRDSIIDEVRSIARIMREAK